MTSKANTLFVLSIIIQVLLVQCQQNSDQPQGEFQDGFQDLKSGSKKTLSATKGALKNAWNSDRVQSGVHGTHNAFGRLKNGVSNMFANNGQHQQGDNSDDETAPLADNNQQQQGHHKGFMGHLKNGWNGVKNTANSAWNSDNVQGAVRNGRQWGKSAINGVQNGGSKLWNSNPVQGTVKRTKGLWNGIKNRWNQNGQNQNGPETDDEVGDDQNSVDGQQQNGWGNSVRNGFNRMKNVANGAWNSNTAQTMKGKLGNGWQSARNTANNAWNSDTVQGAWGKTKGAFGRLKNGVSGFFGRNHPGGGGAGGANPEEQTDDDETADDQQQNDYGGDQQQDEGMDDDIRDQEPDEVGGDNPMMPNDPGNQSENDGQNEDNMDDADEQDNIDDGGGLVSSRRRNEVAATPEEFGAQQNLPPGHLNPGLSLTQDAIGSEFVWEYQKSLADDSLSELQLQQESLVPQDFLPYGEEDKHPRRLEIIKNDKGVWKKYARIAGTDKISTGIHQNAQIADEPLLS